MHGAGLTCSVAHTLQHRAPMLVTLDPRDERPLYLQIVDQVRRALLEGTLRAEDPLPSVRELAGQLVVNPRTVSRAINNSSFVGITQTDVRESSDEIFPSPPRAAAFASSSIRIPIASSCSHASARTSGAFSPIPPVKIRASAPLSTAW